MDTFNNEDHDKFSRKIGEQERLKLSALRDKKRSVWMGLGVFGMVGWSVVVPALLGAFIGLWLDNNYPESYSWTLTLLLAGLISGCLIVWNWIDKEHKEISKNDTENEE